MHPHAEDITTDPDWIRERDERLEREIREQEQILDREIREREIRESEQHYEAVVTAKRNSRIRAQLSYENPYDPAEEGEELRYVVTDEEQQLHHHQQMQQQQPPYPPEQAEQQQPSSMGAKQKQPSSQGKKRSSPPKNRAAGNEQPAEQDKPREKRHTKDKRQHRKHATSNPSEVPELKASTSEKRNPRSRHESTRRSIRRQAQVQDQDHAGHSGSAGKKSKQPMDDPGGGAISGADMSDVFDEESQQYYGQEDDMKYIEDRSNCRKK